MFFINEIPKCKLRKTKFLLPFDMSNKKKGGVAILMTPNYNASKNLMINDLIEPKYYTSYYMNRSVMYYISGNTALPLDESSIMNEAFENILNQSGFNKLTYRGYSNDTDYVEKIINFGTINRLNRYYKVKLPEEIIIEVHRSANCPEPTKDIIHVCSTSTYNKAAFGDYEKYLKFCTIITLLKNLNENMYPILMYSIALYDSSVYSRTDRSWEFNEDLHTICDSIDNIVKAKGYQYYIDKIVLGKDNRKIFSKFLKFTDIRLSVNDVIHIFDKYISMNGSVSASTIGESSTTLLEGSDYLNIGADQYIIFESANDSKLKNILYKDRMKNNKEQLLFYDTVKKDIPYITHTYVSIERYKELNLFYDMHYYNDIFIKNSALKGIRGYDTYTDLMNRMINDPSIQSYKEKVVLIPIREWIHNENDWLITKNINPISCLYRDMMTAPNNLTKYGDTLFVFLGDKSYFTMSFDEYDTKQNGTFLRFIKTLFKQGFVPDTDENEKEDSPNVITTQIIDNIEKSTKNTIDDISTNNEIDENDPKKQIVDKVSKAASNKVDIDSTIDSMENEEDIKKIIIQLSEEPDDGPKLSAARSARLLKLKNDILDQKLNDYTVKELITPIDADSPSNNILKEIEEPMKLDIDSVNENWTELKFAKKDKLDSYTLQHFITSIFYYFSNLEPPMVLKDITASDTSTANDAIETYVVHYEDDKGDRYTIKLDIPIFVDDKYLKLRGNRKELPYQLFLMPIIKTAEDTVQIVTCYNKIFIYRFGTSAGRTIPACSKLMKILDSNKYTGLKISSGNNQKICSKYEVPIDYIDLASVYSKITTPKNTIYFNQDELRKFYKVDDTKGVPVGIDNNTKEIIYYNTEKDNKMYSEFIMSTIASGLKNPSQFIEDYNNASRSTKYAYSRASILGNKIPVIVVCSYYEGLENTLKKAKIKYTLSEKRPKLTDDTDIIKFKDGYLSYELTYDSSLLMNGLKDCPTNDTSIFDINKKITYLQYLDYFGGRILSDGLDNYYQLMIDPITYQALTKYKLPTDMVSILLYSNQLLADNKFINHTDISDSRRMRRQEILAQNLYKVLATQYGNYAISRKHGRGKGFSVKQSAVIDEFMSNNITADQSMLNPLMEYESYNSVTTKGPSGLNSERSYTLDKRTFDQSMLNIMSMSTGAAGTVGVTRQITLDPDINGSLGYVKGTTENISEIDPIKTLCMTEALTPMGTTHDDPFRVAMNLTQTAKHGMRIKESDPLLISNGADEALPYLISNTFVFKTKKNGKVLEKTDKYMILEYADGEHEFVNLDTRMEKNSSSGFYVGIKLDTDLKEGSKFKKNQIIAYDKLSFSGDVGYRDDIAYKLGCLAKIGIMNTDEGYEDSAIVSKRLSDKMASEVILQKNISLDKNTEVFKICKKGDNINEGDSLCIIQNSTEDEDVNNLLKNIAGSQEEINELARKVIPSKVTGVLQDIIIYRTVEKDELSDSLRKIVNTYEKEINETKKIMKKYGLNTSTLPSTDKLPMTGKLKHVDGVLIELYMKYEDKFKVGDKMVYWSALKGVCKDIFPEGLEPTSEYRPNEPIDALLSTGSINARMTGSIIIVGCINKILIELGRQCKDILEIPYEEII